MSIDRYSLGTNATTVAAGSTATIGTSPFTERNLVRGVIELSPDFEGVAKIQGSDDNSSFSDLATASVATNAAFTKPLTHPALAISATAENYQVGAITFMIKGVTYTKSADTSEALVAAKTIAANKFGVFLIGVNAAGTLSSTPAADAMAYDTAALALAAMPAVPAGDCPLGYILIENNAGTWTSVTDDLTNASDVTSATFVSGVANLAASYTVPKTTTAEVVLKRYMRYNVTELRDGLVESVYLEA